METNETKEMKQRKTVAAVICNYNKSRYVTQCIQSVLESLFEQMDIIVVDNASTDDSVLRIRESYGEQVVLLENKENLGGSGGFNTGIRYAMARDYKYIWCLDNDVLVDENAVGELYAFLEAHPEVGMAGSKVYHMEAPDYVQQFGIAIDWDEFCCEAKYCNRLEDGTMPEVVYSDAVAACSVLVRAEVIRRIGMLPEENFLYWDDTEWGWRCNLAGYKVASVGASKVLHSMGAKKEAENTFPTYYAWRNWIQFFMKYTEEDKLEAMCESFLEGIFEIAYDGMYKGEKNRTRTVMYAYDDAIHGIKGKAGENRIFALDKNTEKLQRLLEGISRVEIRFAQEELSAEELEEQIRRINPEAEIVYGKDRAADGIRENCGKENVQRALSGAGVRTLVLCRDIFSLKDYSLKRIYIDLEGRIVETEEDVFLLFNKANSCKMFLFTNRPLFLEQVKAVRKEIGMRTGAV